MFVGLLGERWNISIFPRLLLCLVVLCPTSCAGNLFLKAIWTFRDVSGDIYVCVFFFNLPRLFQIKIGFNLGCGAVWFSSLFLSVSFVIKTEISRVTLGLTYTLLKPSNSLLSNTLKLFCQEDAGFFFVAMCLRCHLCLINSKVANINQEILI